MSALVNSRAVWVNSIHDFSLSTIMALSPLMQLGMAPSSVVVVLNMNLHPFTQQPTYFMTGGPRILAGLARRKPRRLHS